MATKQQTYQDRIVRIPGLVGEKPVIKGTRIPVKIVLKRLAQDLDTKTLFEDYPHLTEEDVKATLTYAEHLLEHEEQQKRSGTEQQQQAIEETLSLAGVWSDIPSDDMEERLDRIRHESPPTPPLEHL